MQQVPQKNEYSVICIKKSQCNFIAPSIEHVQIHNQKGKNATKTY